MAGNGIELGSAYISISARTDNMAKQIQAALNGSAKVADQAGTDIGKRLAASLRSSTAGAGRTSAKKFFDEFDTTAKRVGAISGLVIGKTIGLGITAGLKTVAFTGAVFATLERAAKATAVRIGTMMAATLRAAMVGALGAVGLAGGGIVGAALFGGLDRLKTLQSAKVQLGAMKKSAQEINQITNDILELVNGTPIGLDKALQAVPQALGAGVKQGKELVKYLEMIGNLTAATGGNRSFEEMSMIIGEVTRNKFLALEDLKQLNSAGVDLRSTLKNAFGWDDKTFDKKLKDHKITLEEIEEATGKAFGTGPNALIKKMGDTFDGAVSKMKSSLARVGANFIAAAFGAKNGEDPLKGATDGINKLTDKLKAVETWVTTHGDDIHNFFRTMGDVANDTANALGKIKDFFTWMDEHVPDPGEAGKATRDWLDRTIGPGGMLPQELAPGMPTAGADTVPFNAGPMSPRALAQLPGGAGRNGPHGGYADRARGGAPAALPGGLLAGIPAGRYVTADEYMAGRGRNGESANDIGDLTKGLGDCTSTIEDLINIMDGKPTGGRTLATGNAAQVLPKMGFLPGMGGPGDFRIGYNSGHMQATLPDGTPWNWGSDAAAQAAGRDGSMGADDPAFTNHYYRPGGNSGTVAVPSVDGGYVPMTPDQLTNPNLSAPTPNAPNAPGKDWRSMLMPGYASGGGVWGAGSAKSDSIPAMLSSGEHVLTAEDVQKLGGQSGVYNFRSALQQGLIPGFAPGGAVDPSQLQDLQNQIADQTNAVAVAQAQLQETLARGDASKSQILSSQQAFENANRDLQRSQSNYPIIASGGTPPDTSAADSIYNADNAFAMAQARLAELPEDASASDKLAAQYGVDSTDRDRRQARDAAGKGTDFGTSFIDAIRTQGFSPVANTGVAGTSSLSGILNLGNEAVGGLIDTGASLAQSAVSAGITAGTMGAGAAAGPAASAAAGFGIQMGAAELKRGVSYGFQLASIGADALVEQLFPLGGGAPRWLGYDYASVAPKLGIQQAFLTTLDKAGSQAITDYFNPQKNQGANPLGPPLRDQAGATSLPGNPAGGAAGAPAPGTQSPAQQAAPQAAPANPFGATMGQPNTAPPAQGPAAIQEWQQYILGRANGGAINVYDQGGWLNPGDVGINMSNRPEPVLNSQQWDAMMNAAPADKQPMFHVDNIYAQNPDEVGRELARRGRLAQMQYTGRPGP